MEKPVEQSAIIPEPLSSPEYGLHCLSHLRKENGEDSDHGVMTQEATAEVMDAPMPHEKECTAVTRKELPPLVAMPPTSKAAVTNSLSKQTYSRLGRNILFEAKPAVVHFSGYSVGKSCSQRVRVVNISRNSQRLHIFGPSTDCFKIRYNKKGMIAPGCSEAIIIDFHPREYRYHYDCVRLHTGSDNLLIPVHAYPVINNVIFPSRLDFGAHALGETVSRTVKLSCKVPIQFEYEIQVTKPHLHFQVEPRRGVIPANGEAAVCIQHTPFDGSTAAMELLVSVSQFNFKPIVCVVTGAGRPGDVRRGELEAAASRLGKTILHDSLGRAAYENRDVRCRISIRQENECVRSRTGTLRSKNEKATPSHGNDFPRGDQASEGSESIEIAPCHGGDDGAMDPSNSDKMVVTEESAALVDTWATRPTEADPCPYGTGKGSGAVFDTGGQWLSSERRMTHGAPHECWEPPTGGRAFGSIIGPKSTTLVEGLVIPFRLDTVQSTNFVLTQQPGKLKPKDLKEAISRIRAERARQNLEQEALRALTAPVDEEDNEILAGSIPGAEGGDSHTGGMEYKDRRGVSSCLFEGHRLDDGCIEDVSRKREGEVHVVTAKSAQVGGSLTWPSRRIHQPAQMNGKSICAYERVVLDIDITPKKGKGDSSYERNGAAARKRKEIFFLQDLATTENEERERSFKASVEHIGEPLLPTKDIEASRFDREICQLLLQRQRKEEEISSLNTCLKGPHEVGARFARASLLLNGEGTQGVGFQHVPDWDLYKNDDWEKRREVLSRLVFLVGRWIIRRRATIRLKAIQARLRGLQRKEEVTALVEQDNHQAKLAARPRPNASQDSWQSANPGAEDGSWNFPGPLVTSPALAVKMLAESTGAAMVELVSDGPDVNSKRSCSGLLPPPSTFCLSAGDVHRQRFPIYEEGAAVTRRTEDVDENGPPMDFVDIELLPLREPEEGKMMGYTNIRPPELGTYPTIEKNRVLRWSAFEECGVRQPRDEDVGTVVEDDRNSASLVPNGWRQALSSTERRQSKASFGRRRSSVGLRMTPTTVKDPDEAWLQEAEAELSALAAEAEKVERIPDSLLRCPPPPSGVDLITPDPRFKAFLPELPMDEASLEWCLRPQNVDREVPVTKGMLLGYSPGSTTLRAYAASPRLSCIWKPQRERRASGLTCMRGQASRGVWQPLRDPSYGGYGRSLGVTTDGTDGGRHGLKGSRNTTGGIDHGFRLAPEAVAAAAAAGDELSDSESDDGESSLPIPTLASARNAFGLETGSTDEDQPNSNVEEEAKTSSGCTNETRFVRDEAMATLEDTWRAKREICAEVLVNRMGVIAAEVQNIKHAFLLQTPYHRIIRAEKPQGE